MTTTILDCSGVGPGGITRVVTEVVRHWPAGERMRLVGAPRGWTVPPGTPAVVDVLSSQGSSRSRTIAGATRTLRQATGRAGQDASGTRVLSMSPSVAIVGSRLPVTTLMHDLAFHLWPRGLSRAVLAYRRMSYATAIRRSAALLSVSARTAHDLYGRYGVPAERTTVWEPGSSLTTVESGQLPGVLADARDRGRPYLLMPGHAGNKGVELAVAALPGLPGMTLAVLTGGQNVRPFRAAAAAAGVSERVVFLDRLSDADYVATLAGAAVFLMPSHFEGYGLPAVEALRLGRPTVISPDPALHEATAGQAIRMIAWTPQALRAGITEALSHHGAPRVMAGRSWAEATAELFQLLHTGR
jgi:glycosyltransferase involved in cell wall biosynthesis